MKKRIVVLCDGTWNARDQGTRNNITLLAQAVLPTAKDGTTQLVYYDPGVGTEWGVLARLTGGAFGRGLSKNVQDCYRFLVDNFEPGDDLYFLGFSRGAYTARSLGGLVRKCWVLRKAASHLVPEAYRIYRIPEGGADAPVAQQFRQANSTHPAGVSAADWRQPIRFIGVFDTVGALGVPGIGMRWVARNRFGFHDVRLSSTVQGAFHALAIDERRKPFAPTIWDTDPGADQEVSQTWFSGVHSDVGGGFRQSGLSDIALRWMAENASRHGLGIDWDLLDTLAPAESPLVLHGSLRWYVRLLGTYVRPIAGVNTSVHPSAAAAYGGGMPGYRPLNLGAYLDAHPDAGGAPAPGAG